MKKIAGTTVSPDVPVLRAAPAAWRGAQPHSDLTPADVVRIQLRGLESPHFPARDEGLRQVWRFASPANRATTGPVDQFVEMLRNPGHRSLLGFRSASCGPVRIDGNTARQLVRLRDADGHDAFYEWVLTKQSSGPHEGCWMTDAVLGMNITVEPEETKIN